MTAADSAVPALRPIEIGLAVFLATAVVFGAIGAFWMLELSIPRVTLLGSGKAVSTLVTAGSTRLLIATGEDAAEFNTALERARNPLARRLDVLLVTGDGRGLRVPAAIAADSNVRYRATIGALPRSPEAAAVQAGGMPIFPSPGAIELDDGVTVTIETATGAGETGWRATIRRRTTVIVVLSSSAAADRFDWPDPVSALVIASGEDPLSAWERVPAPVLAFADSAIEGRTLRAATAGVEAPAWAIRVFAGTAIRLTLNDAGLEIGPDAAEPLGISTSSGRQPRLAAGFGRTPREPRPTAPDRPADRRRSRPSP